jgi:hypothetical protein
MQRIMTSVDAVTMRATKAALPRYGASSFLRNSHSHANRRFETGRLCAIAPIFNARELRPPRIR